MAALCSVPLTAYKEAKRELVFAGFLEVHKTNASTLVYLIGDKAIEKSIRGIKDKESNRIVRKALESIGVYDELPEEDESITDLYTAADLHRLRLKIPLPAPLDMDSIF